MRYAFVSGLMIGFCANNIEMRWPWMCLGLLIIIFGWANEQLKREQIY